MPRRWSAQQQEERYRLLHDFYVRKNQTIFEIGAALGISASTVYGQLVRLGIPTRTKREGKNSHNARILHVPQYSGDLAEFCGVVLGDGHIGSAQIWITVNVRTDAPYVTYLQDLTERLFHFRPRVTALQGAVVDLYVTSAHVVRELRGIGLYSSNKVRDQVAVPSWIFEERPYQRRFVRGFFDTDGSIYRLKHFNAAQMLFKNVSIPLLTGIRQMLGDLGYHPSNISGYSVYLTRRSDIERYIHEIGFGNLKHQQRAQAFGIMPIAART